MSRVVLLLASTLATSAVLALVWRSDDPVLEVLAPSGHLPTAEGEVEEVLADGPDGPRLESGVSLEKVLARRAQRLKLSKTPGPTKIAQLARTPGWTSFLDVWLRLPALADDAARLEQLDSALKQARDPVVRQNLIFLVALSLPEAVAAPWLEALRTGADPADAEDALVALAMRGSSSAAAEFERLAASPAEVDSRRLVDAHEEHDALGATSTDEARIRLRSYRALEVHLGEPYFKMTAYLASRQWGSQRYGELLRWQAKADLSDDAKLRLLEAWLTRYPGHPGSDNVALWISRIQAHRGEFVEAARWSSRAAVLPDQDVAYVALTRLMSYCELLLTPEQVRGLSTEEGLSTPNRGFYLYVWIRRLASERGPEEGLRAWADLAAAEPTSELGIAWARRFAVPPPTGLDSGVDPLPAADRLRRLDRDAPAWPPPAHPLAGRGSDYGRLTGRYGGDEQRLHPWPEPMLLGRERLERQARVWETLAELERRTRSARGDAQADLLYKQAAVLYHDRDAYYPAYGGHTWDFRTNLGHPDWAKYTPEEDGPLEEAGARFERSSFAWSRALELFEQLEREHPRWSGGDKVLFSEGLSWRRLVDYRPLFAWLPGPEGHRENRRGAAARHAVACFERLIAQFPESPLVPDARAAAAWWRKNREGMLR